ncbi:hypothetical protein B566_EDAN010947 [Ephemera danica]|nr:hypothetical protein B566_EDAN010947 [Ephemera danica]
MMLLLLSAVLQIIAVEASEEQKANLDVLLSDQDRQNGIFKQVSRELNDTQLETQWLLDRNELHSQVDDLQCKIEQLQQNQSLWKQTEAEYREEIIQLNSKLQDNELNTGKLTVNNSELLQSNLECIELNRHLTEKSERSRIGSDKLISENIDNEMKIKTIAEKNSKLAQIIVAVASEEQKANLDILPSEQDGQNGFFKQVSRELNDTQLETQWMLDRNELQAHVDDPQCEIEQLQQNQSLWKQAEAEYRVEIIQLNTKLQDNEVNTGKLTVNNSELLQSNLECFGMNRNITEESARRRIANDKLIAKDINKKKQIKTMAKKNALLVQDIVLIFCCFLKK